MASSTTKGCRARVRRSAATPSPATRLRGGYVDCVLRGNCFVFGLDRRLDRSTEAFRIRDAGNLEIDNLDSVKPTQVGREESLKRRRQPFAVFADGRRVLLCEYFCGTIGDDPLEILGDIDDERKGGEGDQDRKAEEDDQQLLTDFDITWGSYPRCRRG